MAYRGDPEEQEMIALRSVANFDQAKVLEIGSGDGRLVFRYAESADIVVGCDPDIERLAAAKENCPSAFRDGIWFCNSLAEALPFRENKFDIALLAWSL